MKTLGIHRRRLNRWGSVLALLLLLPSPTARSAGTNQPPAPVIFHVGMAGVCFLDVNRNDATAAYKVYLEGQGRRMGKVYQADPRIYDDTSSFEAAIQQQPLQMAVMEAWQFLTMDIHRQMKPVFSVMVNGKVGRKYLVLTRRDSGLSTLRSLGGRTILQSSVAAGLVGKTWLDTLLLSEDLESQERFFESVKVVTKPTAAVLPVFFGQIPACVVDEPCFEVMNELNPQVGRALQVIASSDPFADVVLCLREDGSFPPRRPGRHHPFAE